MKKETKLIVGFTAILAVILIIVLALNMGSCSNNSSNSGESNGTKATAPVIKVVKEGGSQDALTKSKITLRNSDFGTSPKKVKKFESKQKDTQKECQTAKSKDGYLYMMYKFDDKKVIDLYGVKPAAGDTSAMITYVFFKEKLIEIRYQYGKLDDGKYKKIVSEITKKYGATTYNRDYSNGDKDNWWKTKKATLRALYSQGSVSVYYMKNR